MSKVHKSCECRFKNKAFRLDNISIEMPEANVVVSIPEEVRPNPDEIVESAEIKAEEIIESAKEQAFEIVENERKKAYEEGFESGRAQALEEFARYIEEAAKTLEELQRETVNYLAEIEPKLVELCVRIAEKIVCDDIRSERERFVSLISSAISRASGCESVTIAVHPAQFERLGEYKSMLTAGFKSLKSLDIRLDDSLSETDCLIHTDCGVIDAGVSSQINKISEALIENRAVL
ncbi:MAG: hypothetical protein GX541_02370 [Clostridiales bacterium]|nr:hypothetical protein [Clostridiales bacterium]